ncbi:UDP-glucose/GDP-mannose dehydrogenase family protein [Candidatus Woesearchaeota archaeon]|nr:UDP-glucose/GDP-mannose dehydrogenase family protein [Candidatus Woesearchaeota archaeon]
MKVTIIGTGYVGLVVGACLADMGHEIMCLDIDKKKIDRLNKGEVPIYEPGLKSVIERNEADKRISFTTDKEKAINFAEIIFLAVGTPQAKDGKADLTYIKQAAADIGVHMHDYKVVVDKSTVPVGTAEIVRGIIKKNLKKPVEFDVVSNPEFLREGNAVKDFMSADRVVVGCDSEKAKLKMEKLYRTFVRTFRPIIFVDIKSAEMIKYASNCMLATRISFMNEIARLCEKVGADVKKVAAGMGFDHRIGPFFLQAGIGYGGSCFPKDVRALVQIGEENDVDLKILKTVDDVNEEQKKSLLPKIKKLVPNLKGKKIALWGLAFKPKTDDMREAPALVIIEQLQKEGAKVAAFDPVAKESAKKLTKNVEFIDDPYDVLKGAHCLVLVTEWDEFRNFSYERAKSLMAEPNLVDGRNVYEPEDLKEAGFNYLSIGR